MPKPDIYSSNVFINCPFSVDYQPIFRAILFSVYSCGYRPRCALEISDSSENRLSKIERIIADSRLGIHDISFMDIDKKTKLPRLNMPFEMGMFFAAKRFGHGPQRRKIALVLDKREYRYRKSLSDISGHDISAHNGSAGIAIRHVRDWLDTRNGGNSAIPGGDYINKQYRKFSRNLPSASEALNLVSSKLTYADICRAIEAWLKRQ